MKLQSFFLFGTLAILLAAAACTKKTESNLNAGQTTTLNQNSASARNLNASTADSTFSTSANTNANTATTTAATVTLRANGSQPDSVTVTVGTTVTFKNDDTVSHWVASDPHPAHTGLPGFDLGAMAPNGATQHTFTKVGRWGYHDHLDAGNAGFLGTVIIIE